MSILVGFLSIPAGILRNSWIPAGFRGFRLESVEEWKVLDKRAYSTPKCPCAYRKMPKM